MRGYSIDIRERVVKAVKEEQQSKSHVAKRFGISRWTVNRYVRRHDAGNLEAARPSGRPQALDEKALEKLKEQVAQNPDWTLEEHALALNNKKLGDIKKSSVANYFKRLGLRFKKENTLSSGTR